MSISDKISSFFRLKASEKVLVDLTAHSYVGKFVTQNNIDIGESIGVDGRRIIIKNPQSILSIPVEAVLKNAENIVVGDFNMEDSLTLGNEWAERKDVMIFDEKGMLIQ